MTDWKKQFDRLRALILEHNGGTYYGESTSAGCFFTCLDCGHTDADIKTIPHSKDCLLAPERTDEWIGEIITFLSPQTSDMNKMAGWTVQKLTELKITQDDIDRAVPLSPIESWLRNAFVDPAS